MTKLIFPAIAVVAMLVGWLVLLGQDVRALEHRVSALEGPIDVKADPAWVSAAERERLLLEAAEARLDDAVGRCRSMGQVAIVCDRKVVCLQAPSVAFVIDPRWPE